MWNPTAIEAMPRFWPPCPGRFWSVALAPLRRYYLRGFYRVPEVRVDGLREALARCDPADGVLIAPNHSHDSDPHVMMAVASAAHRPFHFMAAWQIFLGHKGLDGWVLQRIGAFSVDREGCDHRALRQATEILAGGGTLVVFPEGEVYHLNDRLTPLLEGVAVMALGAQRALEKADSPRRVWVLPAAIRYRYLDDVTPRLEAAMDRLERRLVLGPGRGRPLADRILRLARSSSRSRRRRRRAAPARATSPGASTGSRRRSSSAASGSTSRGPPRRRRSPCA